MAHINPALLYVDGLRLRVKDRKQLAVCVMSGTLTESFVLGTTESGPRHSPYAIHKVTIAPLEQEMHRDTSMWGLLFGFHIVAGMILSLGFGFATRGEGKGNAWKPRESLCIFWYVSNYLLSVSSPSLPARSKSSVLKAVSLPVTADAAYGGSLSFDDQSESLFLWFGWMLLMSSNSPCL